MLPYGPAIARILGSDEVHSLLVQYREKFGVGFPAFNYVDFPNIEGKKGIDTYVELLKKAVQDDKPLEFKSRWYEVWKENGELI